MNKGYTIRDQSKTHYITARLVDWIGSCDIGRQSGY